MRTPWTRPAALGPRPWSAHVPAPGSPGLGSPAHGHLARGHLAHGHPGHGPAGHRHLAPSGEVAQAPEPNSSPVLDIGGGVGALVVYLPDRPPSGELEACPAHDPAARFHTGVHHRSVGFSGGDWAWTAVFPEVAEGSYDLLAPDGNPMVRVTVAGAAVHELDLR